MIKPHKLAVDAVFCISLHEREDRRAMIRREFNGYDHEMEFVLVERDAENPERGCYQSHQLCARMALERGYQRVLMLEDDATFLAATERQIERMNRFLRWRNPQLFYLGGILGRMWLTPWRNVVRCRLTGTQAYILSQRGCEKLLAHPYEKRAIDSFYCREFKAYGIYPMISQQQPETVSASDIFDYRANGTSNIKDESFWKSNQDGQRKNIRKHWARTLFMRYW